MKMFRRIILQYRQLKDAIPPLVCPFCRTSLEVPAQEDQFSCPECGHTFTVFR